MTVDDRYRLGDVAVRRAEVRAELDRQNRQLAEVMAHTDHNGHTKEDPR